MTAGLSRGKRAQHARVVAALGAHRVIPIAKDDVIAYLIASDWKAAARELLYRDWCEVVGVSVDRSDLQRVRGRRRRELNRKLHFDCPDVGAGDLKSAEPAHPARADASTAQVELPPRSPRGPHRATASTSGNHRE